MTNLPQLEALLMDAARRRRRTRRVRRGAVRALVLVAIAGLVFVIVQRETPDREIPANTPTPVPTVTGTPTRAADVYSVLKRPARPDDAVRGLPGARKVVALEHVAAWLVPRRGAICVVVGWSEASPSACRHNVADVRFPIVVGLPGQPERGEPERVIVAVFPDSATNISVIPPVKTARVGNALIIAQGETARQLRWQTSSRTPPHTETLPSGGEGFVLHAREESPTSIPAETG